MAATIVKADTMKTTTEISRTRLFLLAFWALITILSVTGAIAIYNQFGAWSEDDIAFLQSFYPWIHIRRGSNVDTPLFQG